MNESWNIKIAWRSRTFLSPWGNCAVCLLVFLFGGAGSAHAASTKLSPPLVAGGNVTRHLLTPDSSRIVYMADQDVDEVFELYSIPLGGGVPVKLSGSMVAGGDLVPSYKISSDSLRVVFVADRDTDEVFEIYSVPIDGSSAATKLNGQLVEGGDVDRYDFQISDDGSRVVYSADQAVDERFEIYSRPIDGSGGVVKLNGPLTNDGEINSFVISPDSSTVAYLASQDDAVIEELYSRRIDGSGAVAKLSGSLVQGGEVEFFFLFSPDSSQVVFLADALVAGRVELFSRRSDGSGTRARINEPLASDESGVLDFRITPDSSRVVYSAEQDRVNINEIYVRAIDGSGSSTKLSAPIAAGGRFFVFIEGLTSDGSLVVYLADHDVAGVTEAFSAPTDGSRPPVKLNESAVGGAEVVGGGISPDEAAYTFFADLDTPSVTDIYRRPVDGSGVQVKLSRDNSTESAGFFTISPDSRVVVFSEGSFFQVEGLYWVDVSGGSPELLNDPLPDEGSIEGLALFAMDSRTVVYRASQDDADVIELYSARIGGPAPTLSVVDLDFRKGGFDIDVLVTDYPDAGGSFRLLDVTFTGSPEPLDPALYSIEALVAGSKYRVSIPSPPPGRQYYAVEFIFN